MNETQQFSNRVIGHGMLVLLIGLLSGFGLVFSLMDAIALWPLPAIDVQIPGSTRGWQAAHVGGILNGVMMAGVALLISRFEITLRDRTDIPTCIGSNWAGVLTLNLTVPVIFVRDLD